MREPKNGQLWMQDWIRCNQKKAVVRGIIRGLLMFGGQLPGSTTTTPANTTSWPPTALAHAATTTHQSSTNKPKTIGTGTIKHKPGHKTYVPESKAKPEHIHKSNVSESKPPPNTTQTPIALRLVSSGSEMPTRWLMSGLVAAIALVYVIV